MLQDPNLIGHAAESEWLGDVEGSPPGCLLDPHERILKQNG